MSEPIKDAEMPGAWICDKCKFVLQKNIMFAGNGAVSADTSPINEPCPNDGQLIRPLTWREVNNDLYEQWSLEMRRLNWLDKHCSFAADPIYRIGPFKTGELRKLADAGMAIDESATEGLSIP